MANKKTCLILLFAAVAMVLASAACSQTVSPENPLAEALATGKPTVAGFVGDECGCKDMKPNLEELAAEYEGRCNILIINAMDNKDAARQYEITLTPTLVLFDSGGHEVTRHVGYWPREDIVAQLEVIGVV